MYVQEEMKDTLVIVFIAETDPEAVYQVKIDHEPVIKLKQIMKLFIR